MCPLFGSSTALVSVTRLINGHNKLSTILLAFNSLCVLNQYTMVLSMANKKIKAYIVGWHALGGVCDHINQQYYTMSRTMDIEG